MSGPPWVKEVRRAGEATELRPHPCFPGCCLLSRAPLHLRQSNWLPPWEPVGTGSGEPSTALSRGACICTYISAQVSPPHFAPPPPAPVYSAGMNPLKTGPRPAEEGKRPLTSGRSPPLVPRFPTRLGPRGLRLPGPRQSEGHRVRHHANTRKHPREKEVTGQGPGKCRDLV